MITKLSKKQESKIKGYQQKWYDQFHKEPFDEQKAKDMVDWLYKQIGKKAPIKIILDSPMKII